MLKKHSTQLFLFSFLIFVLSGCTGTFAGSVFVYTFSDIIYYVLIALIIALAIGLVSKENFRKYFWVWFILNIVLTPLSGLIYLLVKITWKKKE